MWTFKNFINDNGKDEIEEWKNNRTQEEQASMDTFIRNLERMEKLTYPYVRQLKGFKEKIYELRISVGKVELRPLGCYGPQRREFTLLVGSIEKNNKFEPKSAPSKAIERKRLIYDGRHTKDYE